MSTRTEDRLVGALRARAEQVVPEDLTPREVPTRARRSWKPAVAGLAAAAVVAAMVPVLLGRGSDPEPPPASRHQQLRLDLDGDGGPDLARLTYDAVAKRYTVTVRRFDGPTLRAAAEAEVRPRLLAGADLNGDHRTQLVVRVSNDPAVLPDVYHYVAGDGLVRAVPAPPGPAGWQVDPLIGWALQRGRLYVWSAFPDRQGEATLVLRWTMRARGDVLAPTRSLLACLPDGAPAPVSCSSIASEKQVRNRR